MAYPQDDPDSALAPATLGDVLYGDYAGTVVSEASWADLMQRVMARDVPALHALHELHDRSHGVVYTLLLRMTGRPELAEELAEDVFVGIWREAHHYDAERDTVLGWIMKRARATALQRMRGASTDAKPS